MLICFFSLSFFPPAAAVVTVSCCFFFTFKVFSRLITLEIHLHVVVKCCFVKILQMNCCSWQVNR